MNGRKGDSERRERMRCGVYTRKSTEEGLEQEFNSLDAQREAGEAYILSQKHQGWECLADRYDDGGFSGANMERPALKRLLVQGHRLQRMIDQGLARDLADLSRQLGLTRARVTQIVNYTRLAPDLQEEILFLPRVEPGKDGSSEHRLRAVLREALWGAAPWREIAGRRTACRHAAPCGPARPQYVPPDVRRGAALPARGRSLRPASGRRGRSTGRGLGAGERPWTHHCGPTP